MVPDLTHIDLPIVHSIDAVRRALSENNSLIVTAPPGAGKSTVLPLALLNEPWLNEKKIIVLEPRRLAARAIANRMSDLIGEHVGKTVGYRIRFEQRVTNETRIEVVTEGILTRKLQGDNALEETGLVIFDEFHERSLHADLAMALCRQSQQVLRPELRMLVMSATLNVPRLSELLKCPTVTSEGRQFPVEIHYGENADPFMLPEFAARKVLEATRENEGDVLVFLPGEGEIRKCAGLLELSLQGVSLHPLYGQLSPREQQMAILPHPGGRRKVVLATNIAETSLTIEGVRIVIDSGFARVSRFDPPSGLSKLETTRISVDSADQRAGRAGRLAPGVCYRMWTRATQSRLDDHRSPEILDADLAPVVLETAVWGARSINELMWLDLPPQGHVQQAVEVLTQLGALENGIVTAHGREIHRLPCHPRIAHMLLLAPDDHARQIGCDVAAILEERDPLNREEAGADIVLRIEALRRARSTQRLSGRFARLEKVAASYRQMFSLSADHSAVDSHEVGLLIAHAYPERIASSRPGNNAQFQLSNGRLAMIGHTDSLAHEPWLAVAHMDLRDGMGKIFLAAPLNPKDLASMVKSIPVITWDTRRGGLLAQTETRLGNILLQSKPLAQADPDLIHQVLIAAVKNEGHSLLNFDDEFEQLQHRILSLRKWNGDRWPDAQTDVLLETAESWIAPYLENIKRPEDFRRIDISKAYLSSLPWEMQQELERLAPARLEVPSGSKIKIEYQPSGASPVLAVRLQEMFGLAETPTVNNGKIKVVLHLMSPGYKPVQVTSDLSSFWNGLYFEVRKELQRRYPKHSWPEDPWSAKAVAKGRSHK